MIKTQPNANPEMMTRITLAQDMPAMCPRSGNPQPGSVIEITYHPEAVVIEVYSLLAYLRQYVGGRQMGGFVIRDMEQTVQQIACDCRAAVGVDVAVVARLILQEGQHMTIAVDA